MTTATSPRSRFVDLHALQSFPPSLLNRDDTGRAKSIVIGGVVRDRISSQAAKRPMRVGMRQAGIDGGSFAVRTNRLPRLVTEILTTTHTRDVDVAAQKAATVITSIGLSANARTGNTSAGVFLAEPAIADIAAIIDTAWDRITDTTPDDVTAAVKTTFDVTTAIDLALFGRMLAELDNGAYNVAAAASVAHPIGVAAAHVEGDFFTAVDDKADRAAGDAASSNLGITDLTAPTMYRYGSLNRDQLTSNLHAAPNLAGAAERAFIEQFLLAVPSAKQPSTGATTLPHFLVAVTSGRPTSAFDAFEEAITGTAVVTTATTRLFAHIGRTSRFQPAARIVVLPVSADPASLPSIPGAQVVDSLDEFLEAIA